MEEVLARFLCAQYSQSTLDLHIEDNTTKGEKEGQEKGSGAVVKGKGKWLKKRDIIFIGSLGILILKMDKFINLMFLSMWMMISLMKI